MTRKLSSFVVPAVIVVEILGLLGVGAVFLRGLCNNPATNPLCGLSGSTQPKPLPYILWIHPEIKELYPRCGEPCNPGSIDCIEHPKAGWVYWPTECGIITDTGRCGEQCDPDAPDCAPGRTCTPLGSGYVCWSPECGTTSFAGCNAACSVDADCSLQFVCETVDGSSQCLNATCPGGEHSSGGGLPCHRCDPADLTGCWSSDVCALDFDGNYYCRGLDAPDILRSDLYNLRR